MPELAAPPGPATPTGVRGWLLFLCVSFIVGSVLSVGFLAVKLTVWLPKAHRYSNNLLLLIVDAVLLVCVASLGMHAAISLVRATRAAVRWAKASVVAFLIYSFVSVSVPYVITGRSLNREAVLVLLALVIIASISGVVSYSYLSSSKRVAATYRTQVEHAVWARLVGTRDLSQALPDGFSLSTALALVVATFVSFQVFPTLFFLVNRQTASLGGDRFTGAIATGMRGGRLLVEIAGAFLFTTILGFMRRRRQIAVAWGLLAGLLALVSFTLGMVGEVTFWIVDRIRLGDRLALDVTFFSAVVSSLVFGILIYEGLHHVARSPLASPPQEASSLS